MKFKFVLPTVLILLSSLVLSCKPGSKNENKTDIQDTTKKTTDTSSLNSKTDTTTSKTEEITDPSLKTYIKYAHEKFDSLPPTFEAKYMGFDIGDYPHIIFKTKDGQEYDFGDGKNSYGSFKEDEIVNEKSKYNGKKFKITWEWKSSTFSCCDGEMDLKTAVIPCITNLELIK